TAVAIAALDRPFVLLLGGRHKGEPYSRLASLLGDRCRAVVAYGEAGPIVAADLAGRVPVVPAGDFADVLATARGLARPGEGAVFGGLLLLGAARQDYYRWRTWAWPLLLVTIALLAVPLLPFTRSISPSLNGARRWVDIGPLNFQPSELARLAVVIWCAMLAS